MPEECFPVLWSGQVAVVRTPEEVDATIADAMREALLSVLNQGASPLVVDMTRTTFCDSAGVSAMVRARRRALASNAELRIATRTPALLRLFSLLGLEPAIAVYPDVAAALSSLGGTNQPPKPPDPLRSPPQASRLPGGSSAAPRGATRRWLHVAVINAGGRQR